MDLEKWINLIIHYASDYLHTFGATLKSPTLRYPPKQTESFEAQTIEVISIPASVKTVPTYSLNPNLLIFAIISILIGSTLQIIIPGKKAAPNQITIILLVIFVWLGYSCLIYLFCRLLKGQKAFIKTISICLQLFSVSYVLSSLITLIWAIIAIAARQTDSNVSAVTSSNTNTPISSVPTPTLVELNIPFYNLPPFGNFHLLIEHPFLLYFVVQLILLVIYLPWSVKKVHSFRGYRFVLSVIILGIALIPLFYMNTISYKVLGTIIGFPIPQPTKTPPIFEEFFLAGVWQNKNKNRKTEVSDLLLVFESRNTISVGLTNQEKPFFKGFLYQPCRIYYNGEIMRCRFEIEDPRFGKYDGLMEIKVIDNNKIDVWFYHNNPDFLKDFPYYPYYPIILRGEFTRIFIDESRLPEWAK